MQVMQCIHGLGCPALTASMAPLASALQMGAKERAVYLGHKVLRGVKVRRPLCHQPTSPSSVRSAALDPDHLQAARNAITVAKGPYLGPPRPRASPCLIDHAAVEVHIKQYTLHL